jgi:restriction endonuclease Mrr
LSLEVKSVRSNFYLEKNMVVPDYQSIMLPLMAFASDQEEHSLRNATDHLVIHFSLTDEDRKELLPSGKQTVFANRVGWAKTHLSKAGLLETPRRSIFKITLRGIEILSKKPEKINVSLLRQFPEFLEFIGSTNNARTALAGQGAKKGIFITTSRFSDAAREYSPRNETKIVLIDGEQLAQYMIDFNLGVSPISFYETKKLDSDYFGDESLYL